ncbi:MAG: thiamine pyrophosphate-dependent enzyme [Thermodesulfobacteriota bacterium]|nr:thiamine pyrophosphate-dependent enzyme [Thermodesulfobacteriota bacterium]
MANLLEKNREAVPDEEALGRSPSLGVISDLIQSFHPNTSLTLFRRMCLIRYFELGIVRAAGDGLITYPVYLSLGQEAIGAALSLVIPEYMIFAQHRCHGIYLAFGGAPEKLRDELLGLPGGTSGGRAGSNCIQCHENNITMFGHHGLIGENVSLGVGAALGSNKPTVCLFGDGAAEEDYVFAAMGFAVTHRLPVLFICEDNNLSILTTVDKRRSWSMTKVAGALGMQAFETSDDPWTLIQRTQELIKGLPAFLNIDTCRAHWHVGVGQDGPTEWDRFTLVKEELRKMGLLEKISNIEEEVRESIEKLWDPKQLRKRLGR